MPFQGSLKELPLPDVIQLVAVSGKTGRFSLTNKRERGLIYLRDGQVVHAELGGLSGEEAFYELAIWKSGEFVFAPGTEPVEKTIRKSNTNLFLEAARRIDEWKILAQRVPSTRLVPVFKESGGDTSVSLDAREWKMVRRIDERRTIDQIASDLKVTAFDAAKILYGLITSGLVELREDPTAFDVHRLRSLNAGELGAFAERVYQTAQEILGGDSDGADIKGPLETAQQGLQRGLGSEALIELIRAEERAISLARGPHQARAFLSALEAGTP